MSQLDTLWESLKDRYPDRPAVQNESETFTYRQLDQRAADAAEVLCQIGVTPGSKVVLFFPNEPAFLACFLGILKLGAVPCPLNPDSKPQELAQLLQLLAPDAAIVSTQLGKLAQYVGQRVTTLNAGPSGLESTDQRVVAVQPDPELADVACILCTSGTTGLPKAVMLTHANLTLNLEAFRILLTRWPGQDWLPHERFGNVIPLFHPYGLIMMTLMPLHLCGTVVLMRRFSPAVVLSCIQESRITFFGGVPSMYAMLNRYRHASQYDLSSCRYWICGGAPLPVDVGAEFAEKFCARISEGFGMMETSSLATLNFDDSRQHPGSVGPFTSQMKARICDQDGNPLPRGEAGELYVSGPNVMKGYYRDADETAAVLQAGWLMTGDRGYLDQDDYLYLLGRSKEVMIVGGHNVYPREIENVLIGDPSVADAAVCAQADSLRGERIVAFVVAVDAQVIDEDALLSRCRQQLSGFKVPRQICVIAEIPRNASGKILRRKLVESIP